MPWHIGSQQLHHLYHAVLIASCGAADVGLDKWLSITLIIACAK
jgi:hypothetical protein